MTRKKKGFCDWFNLVAAIWISSDLFMHGKHQTYLTNLKKNRFFISIQLLSK